MYLGRGMKRQAIVVLLAASSTFAALLVACGLDETGGLSPDASNDSSTLDVNVGDGGAKDVAEEPFVCADAATASCADAALARSPALVSQDASTPCPNGYDTQDLALIVPNAPTCGCSCTDGGPPTCDTTSATYHLGLSDCTLTTTTLALPGSCTATLQSYSGAGKMAVDPPNVLGGCAGGTSTAPAATTTDIRVCIPQCSTDESVCSAQPGLAACLYVPGDVGSCPGNYPNGPYYVGATPSVQCDSCSCTETGDCTNSQFHFFTSSGNCSSGDQNVKMDGTCNNAPGGGTTLGFMSAKVVPSPIAGSACSVVPGDAHPHYEANAITLCCK